MVKRDEILRLLGQIELERGVRIVFACESGSREWGFASDDSDYDVRFVYLRPLGDYLRLDEPRDVIEMPESDEIDAVGWDLRKFLRLLRNSNPSAIEWLGSQTVYTEDSAFSSARKLREPCFSPSASAWHYYGMAKNHDFRYLRRETAHVKKVLYVVRAILAAEWSITRLSPPPIRFDELRNAMPCASMAPDVDFLLAMKAAGNERCIIPHPDAVEEWAAGALEALPARIKAIEEHKRPEWGTMNRAFHDIAGF